MGGDMILVVMTEWVLERIERIRAWWRSWKCHRKTMRFPNGIPRVEVPVDGTK